MTAIRRLGGVAALLLALLAAAPALAQSERILSFRADLSVRADGSLHVVETIEVVALGEQIRRGIFRDFPTRYRTPAGFNAEVGLAVEAVARDGRPEPWRLERLPAGVRIYAGDPEVLLPHGRHVYTLAYTTTRQLLHRPGEDELYWNVTGNDWAFPIERASATLRLPAAAAVTAAAAYTGPRGSRGADYRRADTADGGVSLTTTRALAPGEGFTVALAWPEGFVDRPRPGDDRLAFVAANRGLLIGYALTATLAAYFIVTWRRVGRDPPKGTIVPLFEAPDGLSPVAAGYVVNRGFRGTFGRSLALTVALTSLATRRILRIEETGDDAVILRRTGGAPGALPPGERAVLRALFAGQGDEVALRGEYEPRLGKASAALVEAIGREYGTAYFRNNRGRWLPGAAMAAAALGSSLFLDASGEDAVVMLLMPSLFAAGFGGLGCAMLGNAAARLAGDAGYLGLGTTASLAAGVLALLPAAGLLWLLAQLAPPAALPAAFLPVPLTVAFWHLMTAPTRLGRRAMDAIEGYRLYLSVAEAGPLNAAGREPEITAALFERHLPYAMALGVEREWTEKVMTRLTAAAADPEAARAELMPRWYRARDGAGPSGLADRLSHGLGAAVATASVAPSSSGGSSGGGFSGGGGGGGGGGGW